MNIALPLFGRRASVFDIETIGFTGPVVCIVEAVIQTGEIISYCDQPGYRSLAAGVAALESSSVLIGHNIITFDVPRLRKHLGANIAREALWDTLLAGRILFSDLRSLDVAEGRLPPALYGKHSLRAWGHRLGQHKGEFSEFNGWSPALMEYCRNDVLTSCALLNHILDQQDA